MIRVLHIITGLQTGGAEMMLYKLLANMDRREFEAEVISLTDVGSIGTKIQQLGFAVRGLAMRRGVPDPRGLRRLVGLLRERSPSVVQTWMYHADLAGGLACRIVGRIPVVWGVQNSTLHPRMSKRNTRLTVRLCSLGSRWLADRIVCCSQAVGDVHAALGYPRERIVVIPNGVDTACFKPDPEARGSVRKELCCSDEEILIGMVARFDPQKDHGNFIRAAALLCSWYPKVRFALCGDGIEATNPELVRWMEGAGIRRRVALLGRRDDVARICTAFDIACLSSAYGEGLPNAIAEAMACGVPCVATDVGGCSALIGGTGKTVPVRNPAALAHAWQALIELGSAGRESLGRAARRRIHEHFNLSVVAAQYENIYRELAGKSYSAVQPGSAETVKLAS